MEDDNNKLRRISRSTFESFLRKFFCSTHGSMTSRFNLCRGERKSVSIVLRERGGVNGRQTREARVRASRFSLRTGEEKRKIASDRGRIGAPDSKDKKGRREGEGGVRRWLEGGFRKATGE